MPNLAPLGDDHQRQDQAAGFGTSQLADEVAARGDVAPLIASTHLHGAADPIEQLQEVVGLEQQVAELGVGDSLFLFQAAAHGFLSEHVVDREVLPDVPQEVHEVHRYQPVGVVDDARRIGGDLEIQQLRELRPDAGQVRLGLLERQQLPFQRPAARVADEAGPASHQRDRRVAEPLQPDQRHDRQKRSDVEARRGRVEADIGGDLLAREQLARPLGRLVHHASPFEFAEQIVGHRATCALCCARHPPRVSVRAQNCYYTMTVRAPTRRDLLKAAAAAAAGTVVGGGLYGFLRGRRRVEASHAVLPIRDLPPALAGLRIGLISDVHRSPQVPADLVRDAVDLLLDQRCDMIAIGGDLVTWRDRRFVGPSAELLGGLTAPLGVFAVLGNHDDESATPPALRARGIQVLRDAGTRLSVRGESLYLAGIDYWTRSLRQAPTITGHDRGDVRILLAHDPRMVGAAAAAGFHAVLSGHTHGGQVVLPGVGALAARRFPTVAGLASQGGTSLFVTRGVGTVFVPVRLNCPPEVAVLTLAPA